ncbi:MAG: hypothetical protein ACHQ1F_06275 [Spirochaetia bacterium]|nr:hypothetical protein [Spirochaetia bacterium]
MYRKSTSGLWLEIVLFTVSSLFLYHTGMGIALFLIPLQVVASRRGIQALVAASGIFLAVFLAIRLFPFVQSGGASSPDILVAVEAGFVLVLLIGMVIVNFPFHGRPRTLMMLLSAAALAAVAAIPAALLLPGSVPFQQSMTNLFAEVSKTLSGVISSADVVAGSLFASLLVPAKLQELTQAYILRSFVADVIVLLSFSWWAGQASAARTSALFGARATFRFAAFRLEGWYLWPLILSGALILADLFFGISFWAYAAWNVGLVMLFLYGLQGMAILRFLFEKHGVPRFLWLLLIAALAILAASPGAGLFVILAVPLLGVSENWIRLRVPRSAAPTEES